MLTRPAAETVHLSGHRSPNLAPSRKLISQLENIIQRNAPDALPVLKELLELLQSNSDEAEKCEPSDFTNLLYCIVAKSKRASDKVAAKVRRRRSCALFALILITTISVYTYSKNTTMANVVPSASKPSIEWSGILDFFPDLANVSKNELEPVHLSPRNRVRKKLMIGIPVAERKTDYSIATLSSLFSQLDKSHRKDIVFVVAISSDDKIFVQSKFQEIKDNFLPEISEGLLEVISVPPAWYKTNIRAIPPTLGDPLDRMYWRTKQNIDYVYIMTYASQKCEYYMQLEDDVTAANGYARVIFNYIALKNDTRWFVMEFSWMGSIGKLFRAQDLKYMTYAIALHHVFKPVDWIFEDVLSSRYCRLDKACGECAKETLKYRVRSGCSQFQHIGKVSSLSGKIQKVKDNSFGTGVCSGRRSNPPATVKSTMAAVKQHTPQRGYDMNVAMWLLKPKKGDFISIEFEKPATVTGVMFLSGLPPAPEDKLGPETTVIAFTGSKIWTLGKFSHQGDFLYRSQGTAIDKIQLNITSALDHSILIDHIYIDT